MNAATNINQGLDEAEVIDVLLEYYESLFPKRCHNCGHHFESLGDYVRHTTQLGSSQSFDADNDDRDTRSPIGSSAMSNCPCGSTLALTTDDLDMDTRLQILDWVHRVVEAQGVTPTEVLDDIRLKIRELALERLNASDRNA